MTTQEIQTVTVIPLTMPRSGSSLLAGILHRLGVSMGNDKNMVLGKHLNALGCYEDQQFLGVNLNILYEAKMSLDFNNRIDINEELLETIVNTRYRKKIAKIIKKRNANNTIWGFKDAAIIYIMPYIEYLFYNPKYIHLKRDPTKTAISLRKTFESNNWFPEMKEKFPLFSFKNRMGLLVRAIKLFFTKTKKIYEDDFYLDVVKTGHNRIELFLQNKQYIEINLEELVSNTRNELDKIITFLGINPSKSEIEEAMQFVHPELLTK